MSLTVGLDIVEVSEVAESIRVHAARYLERVYTTRELAECALDARELAARFAAKEATLKALRIGEEVVPWRSVELRRGDGLALSGPAEALARARGVRELAVSVTRGRRYAAALVLACDGGEP